MTTAPLAGAALAAAGAALAGAALAAAAAGAARAARGLWRWWGRARGGDIALSSRGDGHIACAGVRRGGA